MNNGGIRANLLAGAVAYGALFEVSPFGNILVRMTASGTAVRAYMERMVGRGQPIAHVSGLTVRYDPARPVGERILEILVGGAPLDPNRTYTVAMTDFMASGGDGLALATSTDVVDTGIVDIDALVAYARSRPGGVIRADPTVRLLAVPR